MAFRKVAAFRRVEHARAGSRKLFKSFCPACGLFIAAGTNLKVVRLAEQAHFCQQSLAFRNPADWLGSEPHFIA